uniref:Uncharacterized protein n=1 Tax=Amphimedon queenslandica TaxID=400682 RepID=A0A1X7TF24_AMPQE
MATRDSLSDDPIIIQTDIQSDAGAAILYQPARMEKSLSSEIQSVSKRWPVSDEEDGEDPPEVDQPCIPILLSEDDKGFVASSFKKILSTKERRKLRNGFPCPELQETPCPKLDPIFKSASIHKEAKSNDSELAWIQALIHDPVAPLLCLLYACSDETDQSVSLLCDDVKPLVTEAIQLLGNASTNMSRLRRKKVLKSVNPDIADLADEDIFEAAPPNLFGSGFESKMKERVDSVKLLSASKSNHLPQNRKFFPRSHSTGPQRGGGQSYRGRPTWPKRDQKPPARK